MDGGDDISQINHPASIYRVFKHRREYPALPDGYAWEIQKQLYCPRNLAIEPSPRQFTLKNKFGYVFCHRGLYERASGIVDNSAAAISNGVREGFFLHEIDAFVLGKLDQAFVAHDKIPRRVTAKTGPWESYPYHEILTTALTTRNVAESDNPDFASTYLETLEKVPSLLDTLWKEIRGPVGRTIQIDLRDGDFAKAIPHYCYHISIRPPQNHSQRGAHHMTVWTLFRSTFLKGYSKVYKSFDHLHTAIKQRSIEAYGRDVFELRHLHVLPPLVMVFFPHYVVALAAEIEPDEEGSPGPQHQDRRRTYKHIHDTFMKQVLSFVHVGPNSYNFILEIVHSGLGLGYDVKTNTAKSPLDWMPLEKEDVIFDSLVDRAMIDVSLELRKKYPELLFSSCTRLPDVITSKGKFKAGFKSSRLEPWKVGEEGLAAQLRAMPGGLYPQSHLVVADDPAAEIAARTWIDQASNLDRSELLHKPYNEWLEGARTRDNEDTGSEDVKSMMQELNSQDFLPNVFGMPIPEDGTLDALNSTSTGPSNSDTSTRIRSWVKTAQYSNDASEYIGPDGDSSIGDDERSQSDDSDISITSSRSFMFPSEREAKTAVPSSAVYRAAREGNEKALVNLISIGVDVDDYTSCFGNALHAACSHGHIRSAELLLNAGASISKEGRFGSPLDVASQFGHIDIVKMLLMALSGQNPNDRHGTLARVSTGPALIRASKGGHEAIVQLLLDRGANDDAARDQALRSVCASMSGRLNIVNVLLNSHANANAHGVGGTALDEACRSGNLEIAQRLLEQGAVIGLLPRRLRPEMISLLENAGIDIDSQEKEPSSGVPSSTMPRGKFWQRIETRNKRAQNYSKREMRRNLQFDKTWAPVPKRILRSCGPGCLICDEDRAKARKVRRSQMILTDPVSYTLKRSRREIDPAIKDAVSRMFAQMGINESANSQTRIDGS